MLVANGRATGVALESGEEIKADLVISNADPRRTFLKLVGAEHLPAELVEAIQRFKFRGASAKVNLALGELPNFTCLPGTGPHLRGAISISPSVDYLERAYDDAKYGEFSRRPYMDIIIPSMIDPGMAPPGKHVMSIFAQYAPYHLNGGWTDARREAFGDAVIDTLAEYAPNLKSAILHRQVLTPADIEEHGRLERGQHLPGRADAAADVLPPAGAGLGAATGRRYTGSTSAAREPTRVAASWAPRGGSRHASS